MTTIGMAVMMIIAVYLFARATCPACLCWRMAFVYTKSISRYRMEPSIAMSMDRIVFSKSRSWSALEIASCVLHPNGLRYKY